ncbi:MAG: hypothetical protein K9K67_08750 [Bacteriovoracaceae bacterium]|nr:hypothetical protein [Bacteriovoracaceae bacterium]
MMKSLSLLFGLLLLSNTFAQFDGEPSDESLTKTFTQEELEDIDSLKRGTVLKRRDVETGLFLSDYNTDKDANRTSFLYHLNNDLTALTAVQSLEFIYAHRFEHAWVEFFGFRATGNFEELTENNPSEGAVTDELRESEDSVLAFGASLSYRGTWIQDLVNSDKMFTTTAAGIGWYNYTQNLRVKSYSGPGLKCDFGLHRRSSPSFHYGLKMSYHLAHVERSAEFEGETSSQRSQVLSWLSFGIDLSFYF